MKQLKLLNAALLCIMCAGLSGCLAYDIHDYEEEEIDNAIKTSFDYSLTSEFNVTANYSRRALVEIYDSNPLRDGSARKLYAAFTDANGFLNGTMTVPTEYIGKKLYARSNSIGATYIMEATLNANGISFGQTMSRVKAMDKQTVSEDLYNAIESELTEGTDNTAKIDKESDINIKVSKACNIDVTFVWSGAGTNWWTGHWNDKINNCQKDGIDDWHANDFSCNLYYFTYTEDNIPTKDEIAKKFINDDHLVISGANQDTSSDLQGTTVRITDEDGNEQLEAGTHIGWVITHPTYKFHDYWNPENADEEVPYIYSIAAYNPGEKSQSMRYIYGEGDDRVIVYGMEDCPIADGIKVAGEQWADHETHTETPSQSSYFILESDHDYNDVLFTVKASDPSAIIEDDTPTLPDATPIYSTETDEGTLLYEDLYPQQGDYDMNDVVIVYELTKTFDDSNKLVSLGYKFTPVWDGATYTSQFAFMIDDYVEMPITVFGNQKTAIGKTIEGEVTDGISGVAKDNLKWSAFNPFITVVQTTREVHLTKKSSSPLANLTGLDQYQLNYVNSSNYPFAMKIPTKNFDVVTEKVRIDKEYPRYTNWVVSNGTCDTDWYNCKE